LPRRAPPRALIRQNNAVLCRGDADLSTTPFLLRYSVLHARPPLRQVSTSIWHICPFCIPNESRSCEGCLLPSHDPTLPTLIPVTPRASLQPTTKEVMSAFITELFQSIFTPGPTSTLLVATNVAFACLQVVLLLLLIATYSIHFVILSFLSAGLWWAINWFVAELKAAQAVEDEKKRRLEETGPGEETETEAETVIDTGNFTSGREEVEVVERKGELKDRGGSGGNKSEISTEDEWERVSENEKDK